METEQVTPANVGLAYGLWFSAVQMGGALGPPVVGAFGDSDVGFPGALVAMAILLVVMIVVLARDDARRAGRRTEMAAAALATAERKNTTRSH